MIVVADTSPLNYLLLIGEIDILPRLFESIVIPASVLNEMQRPQAPPVVAAWAIGPPSWARVLSAREIVPDLALGAGETEAISLALERSIPAVLMDERKGRLAAEAHGLIAVGTLNLLDAADEAGLLEFNASMSRLDQTSFRVRPELADYFREISSKRRKAH